MCVCTGKSLAYDEFSGRYIRATKTDVLLAAAEIKVLMMEDGQASLNDLYDQLLLEPLASGQELGWTSQRGFDGIRFGLVYGPNDEPALAFSFANAPYNMEEAR